MSEVQTSPLETSPPPPKRFNWIPLVVFIIFGVVGAVVGHALATAFPLQTPRAVVVQPFPPRVSITLIPRPTPVVTSEPAPASARHRSPDPTPQSAPRPAPAPRLAPVPAPKPAPVPTVTVPVPVPVPVPTTVPPTTPPVESS